MEKYIKSDSLLQDRLSNGFLLLPFYRNKILFGITDNTSSKSIEKKKTAALKRLRFLLDFNKFFIKNREILIFSTTVLDVKNENNKYFNILHGYYKLCQPNKTLVVEESDSNGKWNKPNEDNQISYILSPLFFFCKITAYIYSKIKKSSGIQADNLRQNYPEVLSERDISYINYYSIITYKVFRFIFSRLSRLKLLVLNCGSYGAEFAAIIKAAHDVRVKVAEPQHGMINDIHFVYNFEKFSYNCEEYKDYLPDFLLTFGEFWNIHSYIPIKKVIVGHPYMDSYRKQQNMKIIKKQGILFISQPTIFNTFIPIVLELASKGIKNIIFRLHPFDVLTSDVEKELRNAGIKISNYKVPLYDEIVKSLYVVGETSTCLYEALGLGSSIIIYENEDTLKMYTGNEGPFFKTADDIISILNSGVNDKNVDPNYYYVNNFEENYNEFLNEYIWK